MWPKSIIFALCLSFFLFSLALLAGPTQMFVANAVEYQATPEFTTVAPPLQPKASADVITVAVVNAANPIPTEGYRHSALQPTLRRAPRLWGIWSKALRRTRQLLWMLTRPERMLRSETLALM